MMKCLTRSQAEYVMAEIHRGICCMHSGGRSLTTRVTRAGYYWPTLRKDCIDWSKRCDECQRYAKLSYSHPEELHNIISPWPFAIWGLEILGPFPMARGQINFFLVGVDYFTKWIEAKPLATITTQKVQSFCGKTKYVGMGYSTRW